MGIPRFIKAHYIAGIQSVAGVLNNDLYPFQSVLNGAADFLCSDLIIKNIDHMTCGGFPCNLLSIDFKNFVYFVALFFIVKAVPCMPHHAIAGATLHQKINTHLFRYGQVSAGYG